MLMHRWPTQYDNVLLYIQTRLHFGQSKLDLSTSFFRRKALGTLLLKGGKTRQNCIGENWRKDAKDVKLSSN